VTWPQGPPLVLLFWVATALRIDSHIHLRSTDTYIPLPIYLFTYTPIYLHIHIHVYIYIYMYTYTYTCIHIHVYIYMYTYTCIHIHLYIYYIYSMYIYNIINMCIYIYIHIIYIYEFAVCPSVPTLHWVSNEATRIAQRWTKMSYAKLLGVVQVCPSTLRLLGCSRWISGLMVAVFWVVSFFFSQSYLGFGINMTY
jgi:hypothetical protein